MVFVSAIKPTAENAFRHRVLEGVEQFSCHGFRVEIFQYDEGSLAKILVADGNLARDDVWQGIDKRCRTGEKLFRILYGGLVVGVSLYGCVSVEKHHSPVLTRFKTDIVFGL